MRDTSLEIYREITDNGLLPKARLKVYECIFNHPNKTAREIMGMKGMETNQSGRFTELEGWGVIREAGKRKCRVTSNKAVIWAVTGTLPVKPDKKLTKKATLLNLVIGLGKTLSTESHKKDLRIIYKTIKNY